MIDILCWQSAIVISIPRIKYNNSKYLGIILHHATSRRSNTYDISSAKYRVAAGSNAQYSIVVPVYLHYVIVFFFCIRYMHIYRYSTFIIILYRYLYIYILYYYIVTAGNNGKRRRWWLLLVHLPMCIIGYIVLHVYMYNVMCA